MSDDTNKLLHQLINESLAARQLEGRKLKRGDVVRLTHGPAFAALVRAATDAAAASDRASCLPYLNDIVRRCNMLMQQGDTFWTDDSEEE